MSERDDLDVDLSRVEDRLSGVETAVSELDDSISGVEDELRKLRGTMDEGFDQQHKQMRWLLFLFGLYTTVLIVVAGLL